MFWFLVFLGFSLLMLAHSLVYMQKREKVRQTEDILNEAYHNLQLATGTFELLVSRDSIILTPGFPDRLTNLRNLISQAEQNLSRVPDTWEEQHRIPGLQKELLSIDSLIYSLRTRKNQGISASVILDALTGLENELQKLITLNKNWRDIHLRSLWHTYLYIGLGLWLLSVFLAIWISGQLTRPLHQLNEQLKSFAASNFKEISRKPSPVGGDELADLERNIYQLEQLVGKRMDYFQDKVRSRTDELADANDKLLRLADANSRFVPDEFLDHLGKEGIEEVQLGDHVERDMTIMFTDIREFTQLSESMDPQENFDFLNTYLRGIVPIIQRHGGFIDKFIGDSVMALFPNSAEGAIKASFDIEEFLQVFNKRLVSQGRDAIHTGTGIHTGHLILGTIGHANRLETTVISDAVNTAARVEGLSKHYQSKVVVTEASLKTLPRPEGFAYRFLDRVQVKGKSRAVEVYEFLSPFETEKLQTLKDYNQAIVLIRQRDIKAACRLLEGLEEDYPQDDAIRIMAERCRSHLEEGDSTWEDITTIIS